MKAAISSRLRTVLAVAAVAEAATALLVALYLPRPHVKRYVLRMAPYAVGSLAAVWPFERLARF